jgi:hypothetical protein
MSEYSMVSLSLVAYSNHINLLYLNINKKKNNIQTVLNDNKNVLETNAGKTKDIFMSHLHAIQNLFIQPTNEYSENMAKFHVLESENNKSFKKRQMLVFSPWMLAIITSACSCENK